MSREPCEMFAHKLVAYTDGELPLAEAEAVRSHLTACPGCRNTVEALDRSLDLARMIWKEGAVELETVPSPAGRAIWEKRVHRCFRWAGLAAAGLLLAVGIPMIRHHLLRPAASPEENTTAQLTPAEIEKVADRAAISARMLGAAQYLAENGGEEPAHKRLMYLVDAYPETDAAAVARSLLKDERRLQ